jgi:two-component system sensor histidine kinase BaeS
MLGFFAIPLVAGAVLASTFAGWTSLAVAATFWAAILVVGVLLSRFGFRSIRPVKELITSTGRLADGDYSARVSTVTSPAMRPLVESFNQMAERLEVSDELRRRLLADVGHELRTPLTIVRGELEAMADGVRELNEDQLRLLLDDIASMERLLDDLRLLSTTEAGMVNLERESTDLGELVSDVASRFLPRATAQEVTLSCVGSTPVSVSVDPSRMSQVVSNLVANALRAVSAGDEIVITTGGLDVNGSAAGRIEVRDSGRGIPADRVDAVFDRFQKGADSNGSGLGLTISRELVRAHGGTIELTSQVGQGTIVTVTLPA